MTVLARPTPPAPGAIQPTPIRGLTTRETDLKEMFQLGLVHSFAAAAGCNVSVPVIDNGIDVTLTHELPGQQDIPLKVQLKAVTHGWNAGRTQISAQVTKTRYEQYTWIEPMVPTIVVIMDLPADPASWIWSRHPYTALRHCAYWVNLEGYPPVTVAKPTVSAPTSNVFDDRAICEMMARIRDGGKP